MQPVENNSQSYCANLVRGHDRNLYMLALFAPEKAREGLFALYALATELSHIRHMVKEEMIGHIRYAWWRETLESLYAGGSRPGHPVLEALQPLLAHVPQPQVLALIEAYAAPFPEPPQGVEEAIEAVSVSWLTHAASQGLVPWRKAHGILRAHQRRHGTKHYSWLVLQLLFAGLRGR